MNINLDGQQQPAATDITPAYKSGEVKINQGDPLYMVNKRAKEYAAKYGYGLTMSLAEALKGRVNGIKVLSFREADVACRQDLKLDNEFLQAGIHNPAEALIIVEDIAGLKDSVYELRAFYNRGVQFFSTGRSSHVELEAVQRAKFAMHETLSKLKERGVPAWPEEEEKGFALELCKPDCMTWDQYRSRMKTPVERDIQESV